MNREYAKTTYDNLRNWEDQDFEIAEANYYEAFLCDDYDSVQFFDWCSENS